MAERLAVAMSGGVDSSTAALLLLQAGYEVAGLTMRLTPPCRPAEGAPRGRRCCSMEDISDARQVADRLGIPLYEIDLERQFEEEIVRPFAAAYAAGLTPNPCIPCNQAMKFGLLLRRAEKLGCGSLATGHYARLAGGAVGATGRPPGEGAEASGNLRLLRGADREKDQSYFLFSLTQRQLARALFPVGGLSKQEVREIARRHGLPVAEKEESQETCFTGGPGSEDHRRLVERLVPGTLRPGEVVDREGKVLGEHGGVHLFTVGQRRGLGLPSCRPWYVLRLEPETARVVVGREEDLDGDSLLARRVSWIAGAPPPLPLQVEARIRYRHPGGEALVEEGPAPGTARVRFRAPQRAITPGQAVVFYRGEEVLGGGWIARPEPAVDLSRPLC